MTSPDSNTRDKTSDPPTVLSPTQARQGVMPHVTRYVLMWGLALTVGAFALVYLLLV